MFGAVVLIGSETFTINNNAFEDGTHSNSQIRMLGRFSKLTRIKHKNLCEYIEVIRCQTITNGIILISEHFKCAYNDWVSYNRENLAKLRKSIVELFSAVSYCHENFVVVGFLTADNIYCEGDCLKLSQYGLHFVSGCNEDVDYPLLSPWYLPPECLMKRNKKFIASFKSDSWALGIVLLELFIIRQKLSEIWNLKQILSILEGSSNNQTGSILPTILSAIKIAKPEHIFTDGPLEASLEPLIKKCLEFLPSNRPSVSQLLKEIKEIFSLDHCSDELIMNNDGNMESTLEPNGVKYFTYGNGPKPIVNSIPLNEMFYLWNLCGSGVENLIILNGVVKMKPPVRTLPYISVEDDLMYGNESERIQHSQFSIITLPTKNLESRLTPINLFNEFLSLELEDRISRKSSTNKVSKTNKAINYEKSGQSLLVKERDIEYQLSRMCLFRHLLDSFPYKASRLFAECQQDIPPLYRGRTWAAILGALDSSLDESTFWLLDTFCDQQTDRQLQVDIPRCHQYDELMSSPCAHHNLKLVLKAWLSKHENIYVYWQGLDSTAAPFLISNFSNLPMAYKCFSNFIDRYLKGFFLRDNSHVIQEYLAVFMLILAFIDSDLFSHLRSLEFNPELFAIPWFLTCFAHILPFHKIFHLWDSVLLADSSFPLFIGVAILLHLRPQLINATFNDAILLFSDLPDIPINEIVKNSKQFYNDTPPSCTFRQYSSKYLRPDFSPLLQSHTLAELQNFSSPHISALDLAGLLRARQCLVIDVRSPNEYEEYHIVSECLNCPLQHTFSCDLEQAFSHIRTALENARINGHVICFVDGPNTLYADMMAAESVRSGFNRVCVLDGGIWSFYPMNDDAN